MNVRIYPMAIVSLVVISTTSLFAQHPKKGCPDRIDLGHAYGILVENSQDGFVSKNKNGLACFYKHPTLYFRVNSRSSDNPEVTPIGWDRFANQMIDQFRQSCQELNEIDPVESEIDADEVGAWIFEDVRLNFIRRNLSELRVYNCKMSYISSKTKKEIEIHLLGPVFMNNQGKHSVEELGLNNVANFLRKTYAEPGMFYSRMQSEEVNQAIHYYSLQ